jgi:hypothetical protein
MTRSFAPLASLQQLLSLLRRTGRRFDLRPPAPPKPSAAEPVR